jgi:hypothetical protein
MRIRDPGCKNSYPVSWMEKFGSGINIRPSAGSTSRINIPDPQLTNYIFKCKETNDFARALTLRKFVLREMIFLYLYNLLFAQI